MTREQYEQVLPPLRDALLAAQKRLADDKDLALAVIVTGVPTAGRSEIVNQFLEWLDPKHVRVHALERLRATSHAWPVMWRYWNALPARGQISFYFMGWYEDCVYPALKDRKHSKQHHARAVERIRQFETMLPQDRVQILKLHLTVDRRLQKERIHKLRADKLTRWRVTREERWLARHYDRVVKVARRCIRDTQQPDAPWYRIDGTDPQSRSFAAGQLLLEAMEQGFAAQAPQAARPAVPIHAARGMKFPTAPPGAAPSDDEYDLELEQLRGRFALLVRRHKFRKHGAVFAFEGMDAAGKGGCIRRLTSALDARQYNVVPVAAPSPEDLAHPYLWRFWRQVPMRGEIAIFDRTWYGRVLVERVRGFTPEHDWRRAYDEINEFEHQLTEHGLIVHKFWLSVSKAEQLKRFKARDEDILKRYKRDPEDWKNRRLFDDYQLAAQEMIERTSTQRAPWTVVEADDKKYARLKVLRTACEVLEEGMRHEA
jgi:polyphosphate:AMP phosphotransferase